MTLETRAPHINGYRQGVIAALVHPVNNMVVIGKRKNPSYAGSWQFPQGGIEKGQTELKAAIEEMKQEFGILITAKDLITYTDFTTRCTYGEEEPSERNGLGQDHRWFFFSYDGEAKLFDPEDDEFTEAKWEDFKKVIRLTPEMRQPGYKRAYKFFKKIHALC